MIEVKRIGLEELTKEDVSAILDRCAKDDYGWAFKNVLAAVSNQTFGLFRWSGDFNGLMIVKINAYPGGKEMYIWHLFGNGFLKNIEEVRRLTKALAKRLGCRWVGAAARRKGLKQIYSRLADTVTLDFRMEA